MKTLILHLGLQKTGTTSVQETLQYNPDPLAEAGYVYGHVDWPNKEVNSNHSFPLIVTFSTGWESEGEVLRRGWKPEGLREHFSRELDRVLETDKNLILSGEDISDIPEEGLRAFSDRAAAHGFQVRPIMFVRSPLSFMTSMSQTRMRHGYAYHVFGAVKSHRIATCQRVWPNLATFAFSQAQSHPDGPLGVFLGHVPLPPANRFEVIRQNDSLSDYATRIIGHLNTMIPLFVDGAVNPLRSYLDTEPLTRIAGPKFTLTRSEFLTVRPAVQRENEALARLLGPEYCDPSFSFRYSPLPWTQEAMAELALAMASLPAHLQDCIRSYFQDPDRVGEDERRMALALLA